MYKTAQGSKGECPTRIKQKLYYLLGLFQKLVSLPLEGELSECKTELRENCHTVRRAHGM